MKRTIIALLFVTAIFVFGASAADKPAAPKPSVAAVQVELTEAADAIPAEFRYAIYENLVEKLAASGTFQKVYRSGDRSAKNTAGLATLRTSIGRFKQGSQTARELTTVFGWTAVDVTATLTGADGKTVVEQKVTGKVRFRGDNLAVTGDIAKRISKLLVENLAASGTPTKK